MKKKITPLSDVILRKPKLHEKDYKLSDGQGLYCLVTKTGGLYWRFDYSINGKRKTLSFGVYPEITLAVARNKRTAAREMIANGIDPMEEKKQIAIQKMVDAETFRSVSLQWHSEIIVGKKTEEYARRVKRQLEQFVYCAIGDMKLAEITTPILYKLLSAIAINSNYTAHRLKSVISSVYAFAIVSGKATINPAVSLTGTLTPLEHKHFSAPVTNHDLIPILKAIDNYNNGYFAVKVALQILPQVIVRPGNLQYAEWKEISFDDALWIIPAEKMKMKKEHIVPLSKQVIELLKNIHVITGNGRYIFPSLKSSERPISHNSFNEAFRYMGFTGEQVVAHGFRATARTMLHEILNFNPDIIEAQLAHAVPDRLGTAYNRTQFIDKRKVMMQVWSDYLYQLKS